LFTDKSHSLTHPRRQNKVESAAVARRDSDSAETFASQDLSLRWDLADVSSPRRDPRIGGDKSALSSCNGSRSGSASRVCSGASHRLLWRDFGGVTAAKGDCVFETETWLSWRFNRTRSRPLRTNHSGNVKAEVIWSVTEG